MHGYPFFTKCSFLQHLEPDEARKKIRTQIALMEKKKEVYREVLSRMERRKVEPIRIRILAFGLKEVEHRIEWLNELEKDLDRIHLRERPT